MSQASRPAIVFFDAGLVLLHPDGNRLQFLVERATGLSLPPSLLLKAYRRTIHQRDLGGAAAAGTFPFWPAWCRWAGVPGRYARVLEREIQQAECDDKKLWTKKDSDAADALNALKELGLTMGVISNADGELEVDLDRAGLRGFFSCCIDSVQVGLHKPDRAIFDVALAHVELSANRAWMIGDDYLNDLAPALDVGFAAAIMYDPLDLWNADCGVPRIRRLLEIPRLIRSL